MPILFVCPFCHARSQVDPKFAGASGPCAECGKTVTIPGKPTTFKKPSNDDAASPSGNFDSETALPSPAPLKKGKPLNANNSRLVGRFVAACATVGVLAAIAIVTALFVIPVAQKRFLVRQRTLGMGNVQQIAQALNSYRRTHGSYPTPIVVDAKGRPLYSWRVLILPDLGYQSLYSRYQLDQTWDSPTNFSLTREMPAVYACPNNPSSLANQETNFALIVGAGTMFPPEGPIHPDTMRDRQNETLLVVETCDGTTKWTQPGDINISSGIRFGKRPMLDIGGNYQDCVIGATVDGNSIAMDPKMTSSTLDGMVTPNGGETIDTSSILSADAKEAK
jgi:Protein of unknown function (DUF1559)